MYDLLDARDTAAMLGIDRSTLSRWEGAGRIAPAMRGRGPNGQKWYALATVKALAALVATDCTCIRCLHAPRVATPRDPALGETPERVRIDPAPAPARETA